MRDQAQNTEGDVIGHPSVCGKRELSAVPRFRVPLSRLLGR